MLSIELWKGFIVLLLMLGKTLAIRQIRLLGMHALRLNDTIVQKCPGSNEHDLLNITRIINQPLTPYLNDEVDVRIWGNVTVPNLSAASKVTYTINATANNGDNGPLRGHLHLCDALERMQQPANASDPNPVKKCPPKEGPVLIDYAFWFWDELVAPGHWQVKFDAVTPEHERIWCLMADFELQCRPGEEGMQCMRDDDGGRSVQSMLEEIGARMRGTQWREEI